MREQVMFLERLQEEQQHSLFVGAGGAEGRLPIHPEGLCYLLLGEAACRGQARFLAGRGWAHLFFCMKLKLTI